MAVYRIRNHEMPWGDYGDVLLSGMTMHQPRETGLLQLERTAPFVPPAIISGVWDLLVTDELKRKMEASGLQGFTFKPVIKRHIVWLPWESWDLHAEDPEEYPESGEPEDYVLSRPHSPQLAEQIGNIWEVCLEKNCRRYVWNTG